MTIKTRIPYLLIISFFTLLHLNTLEAQSALMPESDTSQIRLEKEFTTAFQNFVRDIPQRTISEWKSGAYIRSYNDLIDELDYVYHQPNIKSSSRKNQSVHATNTMITRSVLMGAKQSLAFR